MATPSKSRKRAAPLIWALVLIMMFAAMAALVLWGNSAEPLPVWAVVLYVVISAGCIIGVSAALVQRLREIEKGEEDEAAQY